jgi:dTDP-glucose 4,6-dehydratase
MPGGQTEDSSRTVVNRPQIQTALVNTKEGFQMKRALVTGGAGFLGSHICEYLLKRGHQVIAMDNLLTGNVANIAHLQGENFHFIKHDVTEYIYCAKPLDYVFHFASPASPKDYLEWPIQTLKVGAMGTHKALGLAKDQGASFLLASTSEVYGDPQVHPQKEDYWGHVNPVGPRGVYDEAKRFAEAITMAYHRYHGVDTKIIRIFNTYGPRMRPEDGRAIPAFVPQALRGEPITIFGDGSQTRSFCFVDDLVEGIYRLLISDEHEPVNIGNPHEMTIKQLAGTIIEISGSKSKITHKALPIDDPRVRQPNIDKARAVLGWEPNVSLRDGLERTIAWFRTQSL